MFDSDNIIALLIQIVMLVLLASTYPLLNIFIISTILKMYRVFYRIGEISDQELLGDRYNKLVITLNAIPFIITIFFP